MMEQSSSSKVVSLHLQRCSGYCPNASVCYHYNKALTDKDLRRDDDNLLRVRLLEAGFKVHESICDLSTMYYTDLAKEYPNYNITISSKLLSKYRNPHSYEWTRKIVDEVKEQVQISVYEMEEVLDFKEYQKLFLIKDYDTLQKAYDLMKVETGRLHFLIDKTFLSEDTDQTTRNRIVNFIKKFQERVDPLQSADTCLTSWIINGHCPYDKDYLDITFDKTARKCPYARKGIKMVNIELDTIKAYMGVDVKYHHVIDPIFKCIYKDIFKGEGNEQFEGADIQNQAANNRDGSDSKRVRGFSLRR